MSKQLRKSSFKAVLPALEALETRATPAAGITASLLLGQLTINGTDRADNITLFRRGALIGVQGVPGAAFQARFVSSVQINAGAGNDIIRANTEAVRGGIPITVRMKIFGGLGNDSIVGGAGNDSINGGDGNDSISGRAGNDAINGGAGDDNINGNTGNDSINCGLGADVANGGDGNDAINGDQGNDALMGGNGHDSMNGGIGDDQLYGETGDDSLNGQDGADNINGGSDEDAIDGGNGNDIIDGDTGDDSISGGEGDDQLDGNDGEDSIEGDGGIDTIDAGWGDDSVDGGSDDDSITGGEGDDTLNGDDGADSIEGGQGLDEIDGGEGDDQIWGGFGDDEVWGGFGLDHLYGDDGNDELLGGDGNDSINAADGNDFLNGGDGIDWLFGGNGLDWESDPGQNLTDGDTDGDGYDNDHDFRDILYESPGNPPTYADDAAFAPTIESVSEKVREILGISPDDQGLRVRVQARPFAGSISGVWRYLTPDKIQVWAKWSMPEGDPSGLRVFVQHRYIGPWSGIAADYGNPANYEITDENRMFAGYLNGPLSFISWLPDNPAGFFYMVPNEQATGYPAPTDRLQAALGSLPNLSRTGDTISGDFSDKPGFPGVQPVLRLLRTIHETSKTWYSEQRSR